jgi:serine/threonine-protein kinase
MNSSVTDFCAARKKSADETLLAQLCGSGKRFRDRYEILKILGRGGFGITFLARDVSLPGLPFCVIKLLCPKVADPASLQKSRQRFEQEAKTLSRLGSHAQIPQLLDYFEVDGEFYLVQEYVHGSTLVKEVKRNGLFSEQAVKQFLRELLPLLHYVHKNNVIHRDIKPPNIIRCKEDGRLVLIDFGAVKERLAITGATTKNTSTQFVGTVGFSPPEQLASRPVYSSDLYAVGMTCLYLLTGRSPLDFDYEFVTGEIRWGEYVTVSNHFATVLSKLLKVAPKDRYHSAKEALRALELEPYVDSLAYCMNVNPKPFTKEPGEDQLDGYVPPLVRRATEIRDWRTRLRARQIRSDRYKPHLTTSDP